MDGPTAFYLMFLVCTSSGCHYVDAPKTAPYYSDEQCKEEGIKRVLASTKYHGVDCQERKLVR